MARREALLTRTDRVRDALGLPALARRRDALVRWTGLTKGGGLALVAAVVPWIVARLVAGTALYLFAYGIVLVVVAAFALTPRRLRLSGDRVGLFPRAMEGDRLEVTVTLRSARRLSAFFLEERVPDKLGAPVRVPVARLGAGQEITHTYGLTCARRGVYEIGPLVVTARDPIGLTQRETVVAEPFEMLVHPRIERVSDRPLTRLNEDPPIRPPISRPWPSGLEFYGMREYQPGDDPRRIVWRASARSGVLMVRESEQGITDHITIVLDTDRGTHSRDGEWSDSFEMGVRAAASLGVRHLEEGYEVRLEANAGPVTRNLRGRAQTLGLLDSLARVDLARAPLGAALRRLVADPRRDAHLVLVTPHLSSTDAAQLRLLLDKGVSVLVVALLWDPDDSETMGRAAVLGCAVAPVHPGDDLSAALRREVGVGERAS